MQPDFTHDKPNFTHDCDRDTLVGVIAGQVDIYRQCSGRGYVVRYGNDGPEYTSSVLWTLSDALSAAARLIEKA